MDYIIPFGGMEVKEGLILFYNSLPEKFLWNKPELKEVNGEIYAVVSGVCIPVEKIPFKRFVDEGASLIFLSVLNSDSFMAKVMYTIEVQKDTILELYGLVKAKSLLH